MSIASKLAEWFRPCIHMDKNVATMFDNKDDPKVTTIVSECEVCGRVKRTVIRAAGVGEPCSHKWESRAKNAVFRDDKSLRPLGHRVEQECIRCGDWRSIDLKPEGREL